MQGDPGTPGPATSGMHVAPLVLKILITVVVSMVAYALTNLVKQSGAELWKIAVAVVIGGAALIVQYMVDFEQRLGAVETSHVEHSRRLEEHFDHLSDAAAVLSDLDEAGMSTSDAKRLIKNLRRLGQQGPEIVKAFARSEVESLASVVTDLTGMSAHWPRDNNEWLIRLTQCAQRTIDATSSSVDQRFWGTDSAGPYLDAQTEAMGVRRVTIRRLFMVKESEANDPVVMDRFTRLCQAQLSVGIIVRYLVLPPSPVEQPHPGPASRDVVIFDTDLYLEFEPDQLGVNVKTTLDAQRERVNRQVRWFNALWVRAQEVTADPEPAS